jgi:cell division protein FtsI/penicillin-binding protein 2
MQKKMKKYYDAKSLTDREPVSGKLRLRLLVVALSWMLGFGLIMAKLIAVQVLEHDKYAEIGKRIIKDRQVIPAQRGTIYDRNGEILAVDLVHYSLAVFPDKVSNKSSYAKKISEITDIPYLEILSKMRSNDSFAYLAHRLRPQQADQLKRLGISGMVLEKKFSRYYPYRENGSQVLGFCDFDNVAKYGIELEYDHYLRGVPGHAVYLRDAKGNRFPDLNYPVFNPIDGKDVVTTIDIVLQSILEEELTRAVSQHQAISGSALLLDVKTGELLGLANSPGFDPNVYNKYPVKNFKNLAVSDQFEPGSTFKIIALAMALEQLKIDLNSNKIYCEDGHYRIFKKTIHDHKKFGTLTVRQVFENSSNIGTIKLAQRFEAPVFYRYARNFGFGTLTGIDLPAESAGILHNPNEFSASSTCYMSIGYEVAATPLQVACAYAAIANEGKLVQPYVISKVVDNEGHVILSNEPQVIRHVISAETAREMTATLQGVVENGTGQSAKIAGVSIAGKTGTAQKLDPTKNVYVSKYIGSFVGFFPVESPRYVLMIMINEPRGEYYGSQVAAPAFRNIVERIIGLPQSSNIASIQEQYRADQNSGAEVTPLSSSEDRRDLFDNSTGYKIIKTSHNDSPAPAKASGSIEKPKHENEVPDFTGLTLREVLEKEHHLGLKINMEGSGVVVEQYPRPGAKLKSGTTIKLILRAS